MESNKNSLNKNKPAGPYSPWKPNMNPPAQPVVYNICVLGCLGDDWSDWFNGLVVNCIERKGITTITGKIKDQAELFSILLKVQRLGLTLLKVESNSDF